MSGQPDVIVVGAGLGGLLVACEVARRGGRPLVLEAGPRAGGVADSIHEGGYLLEPAAGSLLLPHRHLTPILESAGASVVPAEPAARRRYVFNRGTLFELAGPGALATRLVSGRAKLRVIAEPWVRARTGDADESIMSFLVRRFRTRGGSSRWRLHGRAPSGGSPRRSSGLLPGGRDDQRDDDDPSGDGASPGGRPTPRRENGSSFHGGLLHTLRPLERARVLLNRLERSSAISASSRTSTTASRPSPTA